MKKSYRRRRYLISGLQYRLLAYQLTYLTLIVLATGAACVVPLLMSQGHEDPTESVRLAQGLLFVNERVWPVVLPLVVIITIHAVLVTHRVAGPLYRLKFVMRQIGDGDLTARAHLRSKDYLSTEAAVLNEMAESLCTRLVSTNAHARELRSAVRELQRALGSSSRAELAEHTERLVVGVEQLLDGLATCRLDDGSEALQSTEEARQVASNPPLRRVAR